MIDTLTLAPRYAALGTAYLTPTAPTPLDAPRLLHFNHALAEELGLAIDDPARLTDVLAGNAPWPGYAPHASVYAGHQFGYYVPQLGDGRALMIAELATPAGTRAELQLKGAGPTPYSRGLDGRAVLRSSIREYLCSEAMHALGVPTTRCLSLVGSPTPVARESWESAAVVCRVAPSFVRFGHFEYFYHRGLTAELAPLADHVIDEHFPQLAGRADRHRAWLAELIERTARLVAHWQSLGFCHGVMNTDNFSALGLTLDYGPFGFMDRYRWYHVCNHSDAEGRYAYHAQPQIGAWNCARLLHATSPLLSANAEEAAEIAQALIDLYAPAYTTAVQRRWAEKLGLIELREGDAQLAKDFLELLHRCKADFTLSFRRLAEVGASDATPGSALRDHLIDPAAFDAWLVRYRARLAAEGNVDDAARARRMRRVNPLYVLRNHLAQSAITAAQAGDMREFDTLTRVLTRPFDAQPGMERYAAPPAEDERHIEVSCSS